MEYLDAQEALYVALDATTHAGATLTTYTQLQVGFDELVTDDQAAVAISSLGGTEGPIDQTERVTLDVFAPGEQAGKVARAIRSALADEPLDVPGVGFIDNIKVEVKPHGVPYQHDRINLSQMVLRVTSRPL